MSNPAHQLEPGRGESGVQQNDLEPNEAGKQRRNMVPNCEDSHADIPGNSDTPLESPDDRRIIEDFPRADDALISPRSIDDASRALFSMPCSSFMNGFFCSQDKESLSNLHMIFPTLSYQLAHRFPEIQPRIIEALKGHPDVTNRSLNDQIKRLIIGPLEQCSLTTLIVIDGLDECKDSYPASVILSLLSHHVHQTHVKWLITGRSEPTEYRGIHILGARPISQIFTLHDLTSDVDVDGDISLYLTTFFEGFKERSSLPLPEVWPPADEIRALTIKCDHLFIFASMFVAFIQSPYHDPVGRLSNLCHSNVSDVTDGHLVLDQFYTAVLETAYGDTALVDHETLQSTLASVVLQVKPIPVNDLAVLLNVKVPTLLDLLCGLRAIFRVPQSNDDPVTLHHQSFFDYITDSSRCNNPKFYVDPSTHHSVLAERCLQLMNSHLKRNPCSLPRYAMNGIEGAQEPHRWSTGICLLLLGRASHTFEDFASHIASPRSIPKATSYSLAGSHEPHQ